MGWDSNKTIETDSDAAAFLAAVEPPERREDGERLAMLMQAVSGEPPRLWGSSIIGFGRYHYRYDSGREGDASRIAFPRARRNWSSIFRAYRTRIAGRWASIGAARDVSTSSACRASTWMFWRR